MTNKVAVVTGSAGFIGYNLCRDLLTDGWQVTGIDNYSTGSDQNTEDLIYVFPDTFKFVFGDIRSEPVLREAIKPDVTVFHLAALARIQPSFDDPIGTNDVNVNGTLNLLKICAEVGVRKFVFAGSSSIYGTAEIPTREDAPKNPQSPYALQKLISEQYIDLFGKYYGLNWSICRFFNVYGDRQILEGAYAAVVGIFLKQRAEGKPLTITGDGHRRRDFTHVNDITKGLMIAADQPSGLVVNLGNGKNISIKELADLISPNQTFIADRQGEAEATLADNTLAKSLGWSPLWTVERYIKLENEVNPIKNETDC